MRAARRGAHGRSTVWAVWLLLPACRSTACPTVAELDGYVSRASCDDLAAALRACARLAAEQYARIDDAHQVLSGSGLNASRSALPTRVSSESIDKTRTAPPVPPRYGRPHPADASRSAESPEEGRVAGAEAPVATSTKASMTHKKLVTWHDSREDQELAQRAQAERVRRHGNREAGKAEVLVSTAQRFAMEPLRVEVRARLCHWILGPGFNSRPRGALLSCIQVPCDPTLYALGTPASPQCTPAAGPRRRCGRVVRDEFIDAKEQRLLIESMERAMRGLYHQGANENSRACQRPIRPSVHLCSCRARAHRRWPT